MGNIVSSVAGIASSFLNVFSAGQVPTPEHFGMAIKDMVTVANSANDAVKLHLKKLGKCPNIAPHIMEVEITHRLASMPCETNRFWSGVRGDDPGHTQGFPNTQDGLNQASAAMQTSMIASATQAVINASGPNCSTISHGFGSGTFDPTHPMPKESEMEKTLRMTINNTIPQEIADFIIKFIWSNSDSFDRQSLPLVNTSTQVLDGYAYYIAVVGATGPPRESASSTGSIGYVLRIGYA